MAYIHSTFIQNPFQNRIGRQVVDKKKNQKLWENKMRRMIKLLNCMVQMQTLFFEKPRGRKIVVSSNGEILSTFSNNTVLRRKKIVQIVHVIGRAISLLKDEVTMSLRQVYYESNLFSNQTNSNYFVSLLCAFSGISRYQLGFLGSHGGYVFGEGLFYRTSYSQTWKRISGPLDINDKIAYGGLQFYDSNQSRGILVIEKETIFSRLMTEGFCGKYRMIIITGEGMPSISIRTVLGCLYRDVTKQEQVQMHNEYQMATAYKPAINVYCLCDYNPSGIHIYLNYKRASAITAAAAHSSEHAWSPFSIRPPSIECKVLKFIGLTASLVRQIEYNCRTNDLSMPKKMFSDLDKKKLVNLRHSEEVIRDVYLYNETIAMEKYGASVEIDQLCHSRSLGALIYHEILQRDNCSS